MCVCVCVCGGGGESSLDHFTRYLWLGELQSLVHLDVFKIEEDRLSLLCIDVVVNTSTYTPGFLETAHSFTHSHPKKSHLSTHKRFDRCVPVTKFLTRNCPDQFGLPRKPLKSCHQSKYRKSTTFLGCSFPRDNWSVCRG